MSQDARSANKRSQNVTVVQLECQTCHPPNPHFGWRPFWPIGFVRRVIMYLREKLFLFPPDPHFGWGPIWPIGFVYRVIMYSQKHFFICYQGDPHWQESNYANIKVHLFDLKAWQLFMPGSFSLGSTPAVHCLVFSIREVFCLKRTSHLLSNWCTPQAPDLHWHSKTMVTWIKIQDCAWWGIHNSLTYGGEQEWVQGNTLSG